MPAAKVFTQLSNKRSSLPLEKADLADRVMSGKRSAREAETVQSADFSLMPAARTSGRAAIRSAGRPAFGRGRMSGSSSSVMSIPVSDGCPSKKARLFMSWRSASSRSGSSDLVDAIACLCWDTSRAVAFPFTNRNSCNCRRVVLV